MVAAADAVAVECKDGGDYGGEGDVEGVGVF